MRPVLILSALLFLAGGCDVFVPDVGGDVHREAASVEGVEVFGKGLPLPLQPGAQHIARDVLDRFHRGHEQIVIGGTGRCEADSAHAENDGRHPVCVARRERVIEEGLTVVMRMDVNEARGHNETLCIDDLAGFARNLADRHRQ